MEAIDFSRLDLTKTSKKQSREFDAARDKKSPILRNGAQLHFKLRHDKSFWRFSGTLWEDQITGAKENRAVLELWPAWGKHGVRHSVICADFDHLPECFENWQAFYNYCIFQYCDWEVAYSPSGKVKMFREVITNQRMTAALATEILRKELAPRDFDIVDLSVPALSMCYAGRSVIDAIDHLKFQIALNLTAGPDDLGQYISLALITNKRFYRYNGELPEFIRFFVKDNPQREALARILLQAWSLKEAFNLPLDKLAGEIGVHAVTVSRWLKELQQCHLLVCIDPTFQQGVKAKTYRAKHALQTWLQKTSRKGPNKAAEPSSLAAPQKGEFYLWGVNAARIFTVDEMRGFGLLSYSRLKEFERFRRCHERKGRLTA